MNHRQIFRRSADPKKEAALQVLESWTNAFTESDVKASAAILLLICCSLLYADPLFI
jgi:hypothetical protein